MGVFDGLDRRLCDDNLNRRILLYDIRFENEKIYFPMTRA